MSFWDALKDFSSDLAQFDPDAKNKTTLTAYNKAQTGITPGRLVMSGPVKDSSWWDVAMLPLSAAHAGLGIAANIPGIKQGTEALNWSFQKADQGISAALLHQDAVQALDPNASWWDRNIGSLGDKKSWDVAWKGGADISAGKALLWSADIKSDPGNHGQSIFSKAGADYATKTIDDTWSGKIVSGGLDVALTWYADPTLGASKAAKLAKAASSVGGEAQVANVVEKATAINAGATDAKTGVSRATGLIDTSDDERAQRMFRAASAHPNITSTAQLASLYGPLLKRTDDPAPVIALLAAAGKIEDPAKQIQAKIDIMGTTMGNTISRQRLVEQSPELAHALQRMSTPSPAHTILDAAHDTTGFPYHTADPDSASLDDLATTLNPDNPRDTGYSSLLSRGMSFTDMAKGIAADPGNAAALTAHGEALDKVHAYFEGLDRIADTSPLEFTGTTALMRAKAAYRDRVDQSFYFQNSPSGKAVRVMHWAGSQRSRGVIAVDDPLRGRDELVDHLKRMKTTTADGKTSVFSGDEIRSVADRYSAAPTKFARQKVVDDLWDTIYAKYAVAHGLTEDETRAKLAEVKEQRGKARALSTEAAEQSLADQSHRITITDPLTETPHSINAATFSTHIQNNAILPNGDWMDHILNQHTYGATEGERMYRAAQAMGNSLNHANDLWRMFTLARPGLAFRTQIDTQARSVALIGASDYMLNARTAVKNALGKDRYHFKPDELVAMEGATAADLARADDLERMAAKHRADADLLEPSLGEGRTLEQIAPEKITEVQDRLDSVNKRIADLSKEIGDVARGRVRRGVEASGRLGDLQARRDEISSLVDTYDTALAGLSYKRRKNMMKRLTSAQDDLNRMRGETDKLDEAIAAAQRKLERATSEGGRKAAQKKIDGMRAKQAQAHDQIDLLDHEYQTWVSRLHEPAPIRDTPAARLRNHADALESHAADLRDTQYRTDRFRMGATSQDVKFKGGQVLRTRAYKDSQSIEDIINHALYPGGNDSLSGALVQDVTQAGGRAGYLDKLVGNRVSQLHEDADNWTTAMPEDPQWAEKFLRATDQMRNSPAAKKVLEEGDLPTGDLVRSLRNDPAVRAEWAEVRHNNPDLDEWIGKVVHHVEYTVPTPELRAKMKTQGRLSPADVRASFAEPGMEGTGLPNRMPIHGPAYSPIAKDEQQAQLVKHLRSIIKTFSDEPDKWFGRHPLYVNRYGTHFRTQGQKWFDENPGKAMPHAVQAKIERVAQHRAIQDVQQTLMDSARFTGAHATMRFFVPFLSAYEDAMQSWSRLMYDDPTIIGKAVKVWNAPERGGFVVDNDGNPVHPGQSGDNGKNIIIPLGGSPMPGHAKELLLRKDSLNSITSSGTAWYMPGFGPGFQIPATEILGRWDPALGDSKNPVIQSLFPNGIPKRTPGLKGIGDDIGYTVTPGWLKAIADSSDTESSNYAYAMADSVYSQIIEARQQGKPLPSEFELRKTAQAHAKAALITKAMSLGLVGVSGSGSNVADFYRQQYNALKADEKSIIANGSTVEQEFARRYPEAAGLDFRVNVSENGVNATVKGWDRSKELSTQIAKNPTFGWYYVGEDNLGGEFSQSVYNAQWSTKMAGSNTTQRHVTSPAEIAKNALAEDGWNKYNAISQVIETRLSAMGLHSINQKGAENLQALKRAYVASLTKSNPAWAESYGQGANTTKLQRFIDQVAIPSASDPQLKNRTDVQMTNQYLTIRGALLAKLQSQGLSGFTSNAAKPYRAALDAIGEYYAQQNLGFSQTWQRMLQREVELPQDQADKAAAA